MAKPEIHFKRIGVLYVIVALVALLNVLVLLLAAEQRRDAQRQSETVMATALALANVWATPIPFQPEPTTGPTEYVEPTITPLPSPTAGPYTVGPINFDDGSAPISILIGESRVADSILIPAFIPISWDAQYESEDDLFAAYRNTGLAWQPESLGFGVWLHSGTLDGVGLSMYEFQQRVELDESGNRHDARHVEFALHEAVVGRPALVVQGDCTFGSCTTANFLVTDAIRIPPDKVADSQQYLTSDAYDWIAVNYGIATANAFAGSDTFFIRTCGRQAAGEVYDDTRPYWQQSRFLIAFKFISAAE
jgi:hypothetical protein